MIAPRTRVRAVVFDLDGTLVDSRLDYAGMRRDIGLADGEPILEAIARRTADEQRRAMAIVHEYEMRGAAAATAIDGAAALLELLRTAGLMVGIFTRNTRAATEISLRRTGLSVDVVVAREDAAPKPAPDGLLVMLERWSVDVAEALYVGDYLHDLEAGRRAAVRTLLFAPQPPDFGHEADDVITHLSDVDKYL